MSKKCPKCKKIKDCNEFPRNKSRKDGLYVYCKDCSKVLSKKYRLKNPEKCYQAIRRWQKRNPEKLKLTMHNAALKTKREVMGKYSEGDPKCACCGETEIKFLTIDHIKGGGMAERKKLNNKGGYNFYRYLRKKNYPDGYQVLCFNCNMSKGAYGECPHRSRKLKDK